MDGGDPYDEISLQTLPEYTVPTDGVTMTCITCTEKGLIFLAGRDGHIYEMQYTDGSGWNKRCRKVCLTSGFGGLISRCALLSLVSIIFCAKIFNYFNGLFNICWLYNESCLVLHLHFEFLMINPP